jgi:hypothetical protein
VARERARRQEAARGSRQKGEVVAVGEPRSDPRVPLRIPGVVSSYAPNYFDPKLTSYAAQQNTHLYEMKNHLYNMRYMMEAARRGSGHEYSDYAVRAASAAFG